MSTATLASRPNWTDETTTNVHATRNAFAEFQLPIGKEVTQSAETRVKLSEEQIKSAADTGSKLTSELAPPSKDIPTSILDGVIQPDSVPIFTYIPVELASSVTPATADVVFWVHGGGNILGSSADAQFIPMLAGLAKKTKSIIIGADYRCATIPENAFPANLQDVYSAYVHVLSLGYQAKKITVAGDSSGGNLAIGLTYLLSQQANANDVLPARLLGVAPAADLTYESVDLNHADVDVFSMRIYSESTAHYLHTSESTFPPKGSKQWEANHPLVSTAYMNSIPGSIWPKTLLLVGTADQLVNATHEVAKKIKTAGGAVEVVEYPHVCHGFWLMPFWPEANDWQNKVAEFLKQ